MAQRYDGADKILMKGLVFYGYHGVSPHEKALGQRFVVDLALECDMRAAGVSDDVADAVDYVAVYEVVKSIMEGESFNLVETVAEVVAGRILDEFHVSAVRVTVKKPEVSIKGSVLSYVGVEMYRRRE